MQAAAGVNLSLADAACEAADAGKGSRANQASAVDGSNSNFTAIFHKGINTGKQDTEGTGSVEQQNSDDDTTDGNAAGDISALLVQLMVLNAQAQPTATDDIAANVVGGGEILAASLENGSASPLTMSGFVAENLVAVIADQQSAVGTGEEAPQGQIISEIASNLRSMFEQAYADAGTLAELENNSQADSINRTDVLQPVSNDEGDTAGGSGDLTDIGTGTGAAEQTNAGADGAALKTLDALDNTIQGERQKENAEPADSESTGVLEAGTVQQSTSGAGATTETAAEKTTAVEKALNRFVDDLRSFQGGSREINIVLEPESLGTLTISVLKTENGISAKIKSEDRDVCSLISGQLHRLISSMETKGISVGDVDVVYNDSQQNLMDLSGRGFSQSGQGAPNGNGSPRRQHDKTETIEAGAVQIYEESSRDSDTTVEYRV